MTSYCPRDGDNAKYRGTERYCDEYDGDNDEKCDGYDSFDGYDVDGCEDYDDRPRAVAIVPRPLPPYDGSDGYDDGRVAAIVSPPPQAPPPSMLQVVPFEQPEKAAIRDKDKSNNRNRVRFADNYRDRRDDYYYDDEGEVAERNRHRSPDGLRDQQDAEGTGHRPGLAEATCTCFGQDIFFNLYKQDDEAEDESLDDISVPRDIIVSEANTRSNQPHRETVSFKRMASMSLREAQDGLLCLHDDVKSGLQYLQDDTREMISTSGVDPEQYRQAILQQIAQSRSLLQLETTDQGVPDDPTTSSVESGVEVALHCTPTSTPDDELPVAISGGVMDTIISTGSYKTTCTKSSTSSSSRKVRNQMKWKRSRKAEF